MSWCWSGSREDLGTRVMRNETEESRRTMAMMNWGCWFFGSLEKPGERLPRFSCTLSQAALAKHAVATPPTFLKIVIILKKQLCYAVTFQENSMISDLQMVQCLLGLQLQPPCKSRQTPLHLTGIAQAKWDKLIEPKQQGRGRSEKQTRSTPRSAALLHKTGLDQSTLISCRLLALNSATFHSSHK